MLLGLGMALTMAPATESIMGSLPLAKAGVGSAVNDTTRQVGGALGVAIIGSVLSSTYGSKISEFFDQRVGERPPSLRGSSRRSDARTTRSAARSRGEQLPKRGSRCPPASSTRSQST